MPPLPKYFNDTKHNQKPRESPRSQSRKLQLLNRARQISLALTIFFGLCLLESIRQLRPWEDDWTAEKPFAWEDVVATPDIRWHSCFDKFKCARLSLPLDYTSPTDLRTTEIAITALPASVPENSTDWNGPLLINPGGPGGSGVDIVLKRGSALQQTVGATHTLIGFDPRGVGQTTPVTSCFPSHQDRLIWFLRYAGKIVRAPYIADSYAKSKSLGYVCDKMETGRFIGTPNVARDMLEITERIWEAAGYDGTQKGLRYWGFSYGTALGMTFAAMFPERVERVAVDGVVDLADYYEGGWRKNLVDADQVVGKFFEFCAGEEGCKFTAGSAGEVEERLNRLMRKVEEDPLPAMRDDAPDWISVDDVYTLVFWSLYDPIIRFPVLGQALADLERGDTALIIRILHFKVDPPTCPAQVYGPNTGVEADSAILCTDGNGSNSTLKEFTSYVEHLNKQSKWIGGNWARIQMACVGWIQPAELGLTFTPPTEKVETKHPMLFVGNTRDPVTPGGNAKTMSELFGGGLVTVDGEGHCSLSVPSVCAENAIREYFEGEAGKKEALCGADAKPFDKTVKSQRFGEWGWSPKVPGVW